MHNPRSGTQLGILRSGFAFAALAAGVAVHAQQNVNVTAVNSGGNTNQIYSVTFSPPSTTVLNTDESSFFSIESLAFIPNINTGTTPPTYSFDLLAADNQKGNIYRYVGDFAAVNGSPPITTGQVVPQGSSIRYPNGLSVDAAGNLFLVDDAPGSSPLPQVWVLPANPSGGFNTAVVIDSTSFAKLQATVETLIVGPALGVSAPALCSGNASTCANSGDLLVLTQNPGSVLKYPGSNGNGPLSPNSAPTVLIPPCPATPICIPAGSVPNGIAVWPEDNSLLISTASGSILRYSFSGGPTQPPDFYDGLPVTLYKIKTGYQGGLARAFVVQSGPGNHGSVIALGPNQPYGAIVVQGTPVTAGVQAPQGIAVTNAVQALASTCQQSMGTGCDLLGGTGNTVLRHLVKGGTLQGQLVENVCVVPSDPRQPSSNGHGLCGDVTLSVNQVCPGFDNTGKNLVIPGYLCGRSGTPAPGSGSSTGTGFALIQTMTNATQFNGTYVENAADSTSLLPPPSNGSNPVCGAPGVSPIATLAWAPLQGEGTIVEVPNMSDLPSGCGTVHDGSTHTSLWALGLAIDTTASELQNSLFQGQVVALPNALENYAQTKYNNETSTITQMTPTNIPKGLSQELWNNFSKKSPGCIDQSWTLFEGAANGQSSQPTDDFENAANLLTNAGATTCDSIVVNNLGSFTQTPNHLNPSGEIRSRLANVYYTIDTLILGQPASNTWPPPVSISVSPQSVNQGGNATLSWAVSSIATSCTWSSTDPNFTGPPVGTGGTTTVPANPKQKLTNAVTYSYMLTCDVPLGTMTPNLPSMSATAWLSVK